VRIAVDFDGTIVEQDRPYDDLETPLVFVAGAKEALLALQRAGHELLLWSARSSAAARIDRYLNPWVRAGIDRTPPAVWEERRVLNEQRYRQMLDFVAQELPEVFAAVDEGLGGKPAVDLFIDDKALRLGAGVEALGWTEIAHIYGQAAPVAPAQEA
jgi:hypothetical protein